MPVEVAVISRPWYVPTIVRCSRWWATSRTSVRCSAISGTRKGSPGSSAMLLTSPGATPMWNWRTSRPTASLVEDRVAHRQVWPSLTYGRPTAAGAMLRPTTPARMTIVTM